MDKKTNNNCVAVYVLTYYGLVSACLKMSSIILIIRFSKETEKKGDICTCTVRNWLMIVETEKSHCLMSTSWRFRCSYSLSPNALDQGLILAV